MSEEINILSAQLNPIVGDLDGNTAKIRHARSVGAKSGADLIACTEMVVVGYPPEDLVLKPALVRDAMNKVRELAADTADGGPALLVGAPWLAGEKLYNSVFLLDEGKILARHDKVKLPNYRVFDEKRVFSPGAMPKTVLWRGVKLGLPVCEDIWFPEIPQYLVEQGAQILISLNGSPFRNSISDIRHQTFRTWSETANVPLVFVNQVGAQDELVFDGASFSYDASGEIVQQLPAFSEDLSLACWKYEQNQWQCKSAELALLPDMLESRWRALVLGIADYVNKNGFAGVVLGLSGGVDSGLTAALAVDALGADRVWCVMMPSKHTSDESLQDAQQCISYLGCRYDTIDITETIDALHKALSPLFLDTDTDTTEENLQSRARAVLLMALSNKFGHMVLTTGNKSEMAVGYATLYGDMCGGYNALKDIYKTDVFALANWRNNHYPKGMLGPAGSVIPQNMIDKPPTAELRDNQKDEDSLPPYDVLDNMLMALVEGEAETSSLLLQGHSAEDVRRIEHLLYLAEYKRRQAPPGVKIGDRNFGRDRRYPITNKYRDRKENLNSNIKKQE